MKERTDDIIRNTTVVYTDGISEQFETLRLTQKGTVTGRMIDDQFVACGFIFKRSIKEIKNNGGKKPR
jgi:hypothetical protein